MIRAGVVLRSAAGVAAIERVRDGMTYHVLPGGQVDPGETPAEAARREAHEELGLIVSVGGLLAMVHFDGSVQHYFLAEVLGGEFGTGTGEEMSSLSGSERGTYRAVWLSPDQLVVRDLRPRAIAAALQAAADPDRLLDGWLAAPLVIDEIV